MRYGLLTNEQVNRFHDDGNWILLLTKEWIHFDDVLELYHIDTVLKRFGDFVVTRTMIACLITQYELPHTVLFSRNSKQQWIHHMAEKGWVNIVDFNQAYDYAEKINAKDKNKSSKSMRFKVLKRDSYCCQLCGRKSPEVVLEVDHKIARSKGGPNTMENLWTLCFDCNRGKNIHDLYEGEVHDH